MFERGGGVREQAQAHVRAAGGLVLVRADDDFAALDFLERHARNIDRRPRAWHGALLFFLVGLQTAHAAFVA